MVNLRFSEKKTTDFLLIGVVLYLGASYFKTLEEPSAEYGIYLSMVIIVISLEAQIINWIRHWTRDESYKISNTLFYIIILLIPIFILIGVYLNFKIIPLISIILLFSLIGFISVAYLKNKHNSEEVNMKKMHKYFYIVVSFLGFLLIAVNLFYPMISNSINVGFSGLLFLVTFLYVILTNDILDEQRTSKKIDLIDKVLENVYSPINNAFMEFYQDSHVDSLPKTNIPAYFKDEFIKLHSKLMGINRSFGHLFDDEIRKAYKKVWTSWQHYLVLENLPEEQRLLDYRELRSDIINFHKLLHTKIEHEKKLRNNLLHQ